MLPLLQQHLHDIYGIEAPDVRDFLVTEAALDALHPRARPSEEWVLVRQEEDGVEIAVFLAARVLDALAARSPQQAVEEVFDAFCLATEGISHFLLLYQRASRDATVSQLELETQAEIDKYVTARLLLPPRAPHPVFSRLFDALDLLPGLSDEEAERYRRAHGLARRYCAALERLRAWPDLLRELREFYRQPGAARMERLRLAA